LAFLVRIPESLPAKVMPPYKAYYLLSNGPQIAHVEVFTSDEKLVSVSAIPAIFKVSLNWAQRSGKTQEWLSRPKGVDWRFRASLRPQLALWMVGFPL